MKGHVRLFDRLAYGGVHFRPLAAVGVTYGHYVDGHLGAAGFPKLRKLERARAMAVGLLDLDHDAL